ncbi:MAG: hypothetical protein AB7O26_02215 [Planctomycetaceae bacterium]
MAVARRAVLTTAALLALLSSTTAEAQVPSIGGFSPQAVKPGQATDVKVRGGGLAGVSDVWIGFNCQAALTPDVKDNGKNAAEVSYRLTVPADVPVGIYGVRVATPGGVSPLRLLAVDDLPSVAQSPGNKTAAMAQTVALPCAVDGSLDSLARDYYKFPAAAGQRISFEVLARRIGSPLDPLIRILDMAGRELAYSDDEPGLMGDSQLSYTFKTAGEYLVEVSDIRYQGGGFFYRLRMGDFPCVTVPYPMGIQRGKTTPLAFSGSQVEGLEAIATAVPADWKQPCMNVSARFPNGQSSAFATVLVSDATEAVEAEPNDAADKASRVELGAHLNGRFDKPNDIDRFIFTAKKDQNYTFTAVTRSAHAPSDLVMRLYKADGSKVAEADDNGTNDGTFNFAFPADGDYTLAIEDLSARGGSRFGYRVEVKPVTATFDLTASADNINIPQGGTAMLTVTAARKGYNGPITVSLADPPAGVTAVPTVIGTGTNSVVLTVTTTPDAAGSKVFPVRVVGVGKNGETAIQVAATVNDALKAQWNNMPWQPMALAESVAVGVGPKPNFTLKTEPAAVVFGRNLKTTFKVVAQRNAGFTEEIALAITPEKTGLPPGVTAEIKPIAKDANEAVVTLTANDKVPLGDFTGVFVATLKKDKDTHTQPVPGIGLSLQEPFKLTIDAGAAKVARKGQLAVKVKVERNPAFTGEIVLAFQNLPKGVTVPEAKIPADKTELEIALAAKDDAQTGSVNNLAVQGTSASGNLKFTATSAATSLTVE